MDSPGIVKTVSESKRELRRDVAGIHRDVADLRERMARLEGLFEGFTRREPAAPGTGTA